MKIEWKARGIKQEIQTGKNPEEKPAGVGSMANTAFLRKNPKYVVDPFRSQALAHLRSSR